MQKRRERRRLRGGGSCSHSELHHTAGTEPPACLWCHHTPVSHPATHWRGTAPPWVGSQPVPGHCPLTRTVWLHLKCGQPGHRGGGIEWGRGQLLVPEALLFWLFLLTPPQGPGPWRQILGMLCVKCQVGRSSLAVQGLGLGVFIAVSGVQSLVGETKNPKAKLCLGQINEYIRLGGKKSQVQELAQHYLQFRSRHDLPADNPDAHQPRVQETGTYQPPIFPVLQCSSGGSDSKEFVGKSPWRREWQPTPVFLPGKFHGQRSLAGNSPWGCNELDMTE